MNRQTKITGGEPKLRGARKRGDGAPQWLAVMWHETLAENIVTSASLDDGGINAQRRNKQPVAYNAWDISAIDKHSGAIHYGSVVQYWRELPWCVERQRISKKGWLFTSSPRCYSAYQAYGLENHCNSADNKLIQCRGKLVHWKMSCEWGQWSWTTSNQTSQSCGSFFSESDVWENPAKQP